MADKLIYKGGARVVGHTGGEMQLVQPRKGSLHRFPRWWNRKGSVAYIEAAIFKVTLDSGVVVRMVVPATVGAHTLEIRHDGYGNFTFPVQNGIDRVAIFEEGKNTLYREYQFAKISGGSVLKRVLQPYPTLAARVAPEPVVVVAPNPEPKAEVIEEPAPKKKKRSKPKTKVTIDIPAPEAES